MSDAGLIQLLPKFIEGDVGYEAITLQSFGREEMEGLGMAP